MDGKSLFVCKSNKFVAYRPCLGPAGCTYEERSDRYACDPGSAGAAKSPPAAPPARPAAKGKKST